MKYVRLLIEMMICLQWNADAQYFKFISSLTSLRRLQYSNHRPEYKLFVNFYDIQLILLLIKVDFLAMSQIP